MTDGAVPSGERDARRHVTLVRAPLVSRVGALNNEAVPHLGLAYVAAYVRRFGYEVAIIDGIAEGLNQVHPVPGHPGFQVQGITADDLVARIPADTDVIGFSSMFSAECVFLRTLIEKVRSRFPDRLLVAGGEHFTALAEYSLRDCPDLDVIVKGEGEHTFHELLEAHAAGDYSGVAGIAYLDDDGTFRDNGGLPRIRDAGSIPWPYWPEGHLERFWAAGKSYGIGSERDIPLLGTRGCPYRCTFCSSPQMWTTRYVMRDVDDVIAEIRHYVETYRITSFQFYDLTVFTKKRWTVDFCRQVAHAMRQAALARRAREAGLDRLDDARCAVRDHQQRLAEAAPAHVLEERAHRLGVLFGARHQRQQNLGANPREAPGRQYRLALLPLPASPGVPEGHSDSIEGELRSELSYAMERYGRRQQSAFERDVKAFVWDHRQQIDVNAISDARLIDAAVCILRGRYRYDGFRTYASSDRFEAWCREIGAAGS